MLEFSQQAALSGPGEALNAKYLEQNRTEIRTKPIYKTKGKSSTVQLKQIATKRIKPYIDQHTDNYIG